MYVHFTAPSPFANETVNVDVAFKQNDLTPQVDVEFEVSYL